MTYTVGVDLGKQNDYTAISVVRSVPQQPIETQPSPKPRLEVVYLKRLRGVAYPMVIEEVARMAGWPVLQGAQFAVDATGVGRPVVDALRERISGLNAITITSGESTNHPAPGEWTVPKTDLIAAVQLLLQQRRLVVDAALPDAETFKQELLNFGYRITDSGRTSMEAMTGHDDVVLSVAMACWLASKDNGATAWMDYMRREAGLAPTLPIPGVPEGSEPTREQLRQAAFRHRKGGRLTVV